MSARSEMLRAKAREIRPDLERAREVAGKAAAEGRNMTAAERSVYDAAMSKAQPVLDGLDAQRRDEAIESAARDLVADLGPLGGSAGLKGGQRLSFKGMAAGIANRMLSGEYGAKSLAPSGAAVVAQGFTADPVALGRVATTLLDVLPTQVQTSSEYAFLRQTTRTNNAGPVADGNEKPTSVIGLTRVEQSLSVIAHLSEPVQRYWLVDNVALEQFIETELRFGLGTAVEQKIVDDINDTSGIQSQAFSTSALQTIRKSCTKLEVAGHSPGAILLHPTDWEGVELALSSTNAVEHLSLPYDPATRRLFGVPVVTSVAQAAGTGHVIAQGGAVVVDTDSTGVGVQWSENVGDSFAYNQIVARCEGRFGTSVLMPLGVVVADLSAPAGASGASGASG